jgi:hypothetical protein
MKQVLTRWGDTQYLAVTLHRNRKRFSHRVHVLVLETFMGPRPIGMFGCHGPKGKFDNSLKNVYWATPKQNTNDMIRDGTMTAPSGENHGRAKLNWLQVRIIRKTYELGRDVGISQRSLARIFGVSQNAVRDIVLNQKWKHIPEPHPPC